MNNILKNAFISTLLISSFLGVIFLYSHYSNLILFILNFITLASYYVTLKIAYHKSFHTVINLSVTTIIYQFIFITILTQIYINYNGAPFSFTARDSLTYNWLANEQIEKPFLMAINYFISNLPIDDIGFPVYLSAVYRIIPDPLFSRYLLILAIIPISIFLYKISQNYLSNKYAFITALSVSIANFTTLYASNGLKELFMELILLSSFYFFIKFINEHKIYYLVIAILVSLLLFFFRVPMVFIFFLTIAISFLLYQGNKPIFIFFLTIIIIISTYLLFNYFSQAINRFAEISTEEAVERSAGFVGETGLFTFIVSIVVALFGPLPTLFPIYGKEDLSIIGGALVLRVFLSGYIFSSIFYILKNRISTMYPLIIYPVLTIISLVLISEVYEFRFHIPHIALLFILGFYGIENKLLKGRKLVLMNFVIIVLIVYWNFGRY